MTSQDGLALLRQMHERGEITDEQYDSLRRHVLWGTPLPSPQDLPPPRSGGDSIGGYGPDRRRQPIARQHRRLRERQAQAADRDAGQQRPRGLEAEREHHPRHAETVSLAERHTGDVLGNAARNILGELRERE